MYRQPILNKLYHITAKGHTYRPWIHCRSILIPMTMSNLVLRKIGITAGISQYKNETNINDRQWVFVMCDGLPYCLAHKLIHYAYYCLNCQDSVLGIERFKEHNKSEW